MSMPYYVSPEQLMKDKADYARKGIARGRSVLAVAYSDGILFLAENPSSTLHKISEIYDRIAFAGVGKFNEFENLRMNGVRLADMRGYAYSREDVSARGLANFYSQTVAQIFTADIKPYEVEVLVAQVGMDSDPNELYHILYDGSVADEQNFVAMGGQAEALRSHVERTYDPTLNLEQMMHSSVQALSTVEKREIDSSKLEVAVLDRTRQRRKFRRLPASTLSEILGQTAAASAQPPPASTSKKGNN